jgi:hypothetical protein
MVTLFIRPETFGCEVHSQGRIDVHFHLFVLSQWTFGDGIGTEAKRPQTEEIAIYGFMWFGYD